MKYIQKGPEPEELLLWKAQANGDWSPSFKALRGCEKQALYQSLLKEQGAICCYCEQRITQESSHIEHLKPQEREDVDDLDFSNMLCSCIKIRIKGAENHCGVRKDNWFDENLFVTPIQSNCEQQFRYSFNGQIHSTNDASEETIHRLGLNCSKLQRLRKAAIDGFVEMDDISLEMVLQEDKDGNFCEFWTTLKGLF